MGVPKKKMSRSRTRRRRSAWEARGTTPLLSPCPLCGQLRRAHRVCPHCGAYGGKRVRAT